jgi:Zn-dependent protease with chaperone function
LSSGGGLSTGSIVPHLDHIKPQKSGRVFAAAPDPATGTTMKAANGFAIVRDPKAEAYMQGIVTRLLDHWHGEKPARVGVFLDSGSGVQGLATPSGDILIPIGAFDGIENEDQLAALIGHELGHIVLKHHEDEKQARDLAKLGEFAVMAAFAVSSIQNGEMTKYGNTREFRITRPGAVQDDTFRAFAVQTAMVTLTQDIILTAYSREQEYAADVFGATLAGRAGWEPRALLSLTQKWHDAEEAKRLEKKELMQNAGLVPGIMQGIGEVAASITGSHPSAAHRSEYVATSLQTTFANVPPTPPTIEPYTKIVESKAFARKRQLWRDVNTAHDLIKNGNAPQAVAIMRNIEKQANSDHPETRLVMALAYRTLDTPDAAEVSYRVLASADLREPGTLTFYQHLIDAHGIRGNWSKAEEVAAVGEKFYGDKVLPDRIALVRMKAQGQQVPSPHLVQEMDRLMQRCRASGDEELPKSCAAAWSGRNADKEYKVCGGVINAIAGLAGQSKCAPQDAAKASTDGGGNLVPNVIGGVLSGVFQ